MIRALKHIALCVPLVTLSACALAQASSGDDVAARIKAEGMERSQVMSTLSYLTDVIGPRLTASPSMKRANEWTRDKLASWSLENAHLEAWGPFGRGWSLERFSAQVVLPQDIPLIAYPKAWSPGLRGPYTGEVVFVDAQKEEDLAKYHGHLRGAIVLNSPLRELPAHFTAQGLRYTDEDLTKMADAVPGAPRGNRVPPGGPGGPGAANGPGGPGRPGAAGGPGGPGRFGGAQFALNARKYRFYQEEGVAVVVEGARGDNGTLFVQSATVPPPPGAPIPTGPGGAFGGAPGAGGPGAAAPGTAGPAGAPGTAPSTIAGPSAAPTTAPPDGAAPAAGTPGAAGAPAQPNAPRTRNGRNGRGNGAAARRISPWDKDAPKIVPQIVVSAEQYNRLVRMLQQGEKLRMNVDLAVKFYDSDPMGYNTVAEIPGSDLKDEVVMLGGHMDSWHSGTGATDNAAGCAVCMEAVRILKALNLQPRRTIRIALWSGEEEGLFGSRAYVAQHFGTRGTNGEIERKPDYEKFSSYFNLDNGTGKIRGIYLQGNETARPIFTEWLAPFKDMGATTVTISNTGGTDHQSFDAIGLPGFQFIQDQIEYESRTHHSNQDVYDRAQADDLKQASTIMAYFVYNAAMRDEKIPRKPVTNAQRAAFAP